MIRFLCMWAVAGAWAEEPVEEPPPPNQPEYQRLAQELEKLAARNAWVGAERTFASMLETRWPLKFEDWVLGASAARAVGDVAEEMRRLKEASALKEDRDILDWRWTLDMNYGSISLCHAPGKNIHLTAVEMPFDPNYRRAVEFAMKEIDEEGKFTGYLPEGSYQFAGHEFRSRPKIQGVVIDLCDEEGEGKRRKGKKD